MSDLPEALVEGVELLCLDAGNTVVFLDHARLASSVSALGHRTSAEALIAAEGEAKRLQEKGSLSPISFPHEDAPGARPWSAMMGAMLAFADVPRGALSELLGPLFEEHRELNFYCRVPDGLPDAIHSLRVAGVPVVIVSNSEGMLDALFDAIGLGNLFDRVIDSGIVGIEKPDPRIFELALEGFDVPPDRALHLGDSIATDVRGARAAGLRPALIDPFGQSEGRAPDVPRVATTRALCDAIRRRRARPGTSR